jgi:Uncharacterized protein conserved in bacteria (DUF2188)
MSPDVREKKIVEFEIVPDEVGGWDVIKRGEKQALSNHSTREAAETAARLRGEEEQADEVRVTVRKDAVHHLDDEATGMRPAFLGLAGLLLFITLLIIVISVIAATTEFGA